MLTQRRKGSKREGRKERGKKKKKEKKKKARAKRVSSAIIELSAGRGVPTSPSRPFCAILLRQEFERTKIAARKPTEKMVNLWVLVLYAISGYMSGLAPTQVQ